MAAFDNIPDRAVRVRGGRIVENGAGTYNLDIPIPAYAVIEDIVVYGEALWTAATSAALTVGDYTTALVAIDADGFVASTNLKATDLLAGESINLDKSGGKEGAYLTGTGTSWDKRMASTDRILRFQVVSVGAGTAGRTVCVVIYAQPNLVTVTQ